MKYTNKPVILLSVFFLSIFLLPIFLLSAVPPSSAQTLERPSTKAKCGIAHSKRQKTKCVCTSGYLYNKNRKKCIKAVDWCRAFWAEKSTYSTKKKQCVCPSGRALAEGTVASCVKDKVFEGEVTLDDSNQSGGSGQFDFETQSKSLNGADLYIAGLTINGYWTGAVDWQVVIMTQPFDQVKECPAGGYANADDPDGDGWGSPRTAYSGGVYCLKTGSDNYAKILVESADYSYDTDLRTLKFKYAFRLKGNRSFP